jgi:hypothetical protein
VTISRQKTKQATIADRWSASWMWRIRFGDKAARTPQVRGSPSRVSPVGAERDLGPVYSPCFRRLLEMAAAGGRHSCISRLSGRRILARRALPRARRSCQWPASEGADCLVPHYAGCFLPPPIPTTSAGIWKNCVAKNRVVTKTPSGNAWCFFAPSDSRHVRAQASGKIASRKIVCWPALAAGLGGARLPAARSQRSCN